VYLDLNSLQGLHGEVPRERKSFTLSECFYEVKLSLRKDGVAIC